MSKVMNMHLNSEFLETLCQATVITLGALVLYFIDVPTNIKYRQMDILTCLFTSSRYVGKAETPESV